MCSMRVHSQPASVVVVMAKKILTCSVLYYSLSSEPVVETFVIHCITYSTYACVVYCTYRRRKLMSGRRSTPSHAKTPLHHPGSKLTPTFGTSFSDNGRTSPGACDVTDSKSCFFFPDKWHRYNGTLHHFVVE